MLSGKYLFQCSKLIKSAQVRKFVSYLTVIILLFIFQNQLYAQRKNQVHRIVIDAGHGGHDPGARGKSCREKDITLSIALKTGKLIKKNCPGVEVIYTRETDVFVELYRRAQIANENKADLFISIHCNANPSPFPYGTECYVMGLHKSDANLAVAKTENASILLEDNYSKRYDGFDPNSPEAYIIFNLFQNAYLDKSLDFASRVETNFTAHTQMPDRGVKQAGFLVLYRTTMPGVLVETGFISNTKDEAFLMSPKGQDRVAFSIYRAFDEYRRSFDPTLPKGSTSIVFDDSLFQSHPAIRRLKRQEILLAGKSDTVSDMENRKSLVNAAQKNISGSEKDRKDNAIHEDNLPHVSEKTDVVSQKKNSVPSEKNPRLVIKVDSNNQKTNRFKIDETRVKTDEPKVVEKPVPANTTPENINSGITFRVQFKISSVELSLTSKEFTDIPNAKVYVQNGVFKYTAGDEATSAAADHLRRIIAGKGYKDAFILPFFNGKRITMKEAYEMMKNKQ
ncbi:MAG: N-acetylmuramoyl-L-alanine amidase [Bacteroidetes bacterium]|nr:N-acetylmuramoyl-L-alanine amidase [Bacteroidota bacterium]